MLTGRTNTLRVYTPEGITFSLLLASPITRFLAATVDIACIAAVNIAVSYGAAMFRLISDDLAAALMVIGYFAIAIGYGIALEWFWRGQTVGKKLLRLRVMDAQGLKLNFSQVALRNLLRSIDMLPAFYALGGAVALLSRHSQRLGDIAAGTIVVRNPAISAPDLDQIGVPQWNSLREYPHLYARLRQRVNARTAAIAVDAIVRREELEPAQRVALFGELAAYFKSITPFPAEAAEGLSDEQYVRNVADVLFR